MGEPCLRVDKWLWHARFVKSRTLGQKLVASGAVRVNRAPVMSPAQAVRPGDVLTLGLPRRILVARVVELGERRGPAPEARGLYEILEDSAAADPPGMAPPPGA